MKTKKFTIYASIAIIILGFSAFKSMTNEATAAWWNEGWLYRKALTINSAKVAADLTDFPVLVSLTSSDFVGKTQSDGGDFVFTLNDGTKLKHEIDAYASSTGALTAWVKMPNLSSTQDETIYIYYGNATVTDQEEPGQVWKESYKGVWHMSEATGANRLDSTVNANTLTDNPGDQVAYTSSGKIGGAGDFESGDTGDFLYADETSSLDINGADQNITISAWVWRESDSGAAEVIVGKYDYGTEQRQYQLSISTEDHPQIVLSPDGVNAGGAWGNSVITTGSWEYFVGTYDDAYDRIFLNGSLDTSISNPYATTTGIFNSSADFTLGAYLNNGVGSRYWDGLIDEVRISNTAHTAAWIETEYNNQNDPASFFAVQAEEAGPGPVGYWSFDEGYGSTAHDGSGQGNDGTITGAVWKPESECVSGKCLYFDGNDHVQMPFIDIHEDDNTVSMWIKTSTTSNVYLFFAREDDATGLAEDLYALYMDQGKLNIAIRTENGETGGSRISASSARDFNDNKWHFIMMKKQGESLKLYADGISECELSFTEYSSEIDVNWLGAEESDTESLMSYWQGFIDEVRIYKYARSEEEMKKDYNSGLAGQNTSQGAAVAFGSASDKWLTDGLAGYWKFDESATTSGALDSSGNGSIAEYYGDASTTAGKYGTGAEFDGVDDVVSVTDAQLSGNFPGKDNYNAEAMTLSLWIKYDSFTGRPIRKPTIFQVNGDEFGLATENGSGYLDITGTVTGTWYHIVYVYDGRNIYGYLNGVENGQPVPLTGRIEENNEEFSIGAGSYPVTSPFNGKIDEVRVYSRALSSGEVKKLYEWAPGPLAHWKIDDHVAGDGRTILDISGNQKHGTTSDGLNDTGMVCGKRGKYGSACFLDGVDDYIDMGTDKTFEFGLNSFSVGFWFYPLTFAETDVDYIVNKVHSSYSEGWSFSLTPSGLVRLWYRWDTEHHTSLDSAPVELNKWSYATMIVDRENGSVTLLVNGVKQLGGSVNGWGNIDATGYPLQIGRRRIDYPYFHGFVDDLRIYNYARTQRQILEDMDGGRPAVNSPLLSYSFDEGFGNVAYNSGFGGAIFGGTLNSGGTGINDTNAKMWEKNGKINGAMDFDELNDYLDISDFNYNSEFSMSFWFNVSEVDGSYQYLLSHGGFDVVNSVNFLITEEEHISSAFPYSELGVCLRDSDDGSCNTISYALNSGFNVVDGSWHHAVLSVNSNGSDFYVDGKYRDSSSSGGDSLNPSTNFNIGRRTDGDADRYFGGLIDEVKVWNFALNENEVLNEYNAGQAAVMGEDASRSNDGTAVNGAGKEYCIPGDTATCTPPVLELKFNEKSGTTTYDTSGTGLSADFASIETSPAWKKGLYGSALDFDGGDYADFGYNSVLEGMNELTVSGWIYRRSADGYVEPFGKVNSYYLDLLDGCRFVLYTSGLDKSVNCPTIPIGEWMHFAAVYNGSTLIIYQNGKFATSTSGYSGAVDSNASRNFCIGAGSTSGCAADATKFIGSVDDVRVYRYARTPAQIAWDYNRGKPVAHWRFDECQGSTIHDYQGTNHGTLNLGASGVTSIGACASSSDSFWYNGRSGKYNAGGSFDGTDDYVTLPFTGGENNIEDQAMFTLSGWFKASSAISTERIIYSEKNSADGSSLNLLQINDDGQKGVLTWSQRDNADYRADLTYDGGLSDDSWHHFAIIRNGSNAKMYVDGKLADESDDFSFGAFTFDSALLGAQKNGTSAWSGFFQGLLDDIKINDNALTAEQVRQEYNGGAVRFGG